LGSGVQAGAGRPGAMPIAAPPVTFLMVRVPGLGFRVEDVGCDLDLSHVVLASIFRVDFLV